jgi:hypothetical protein
MIDTVFNFGTSKTPGYRSFVGSDIQQQLDIGFALLVIVIILIPIMLFVKPCCFRGDHHDDDNEGENNQIEFANINNIDNQQNQVNRSDGVGNTDDAMNKRQDEMRQLEQQI